MATNMNGRVGDHNDTEAAATERPLLRSFPNPSGYGTPNIAWKKQEVPVTTRIRKYLTADIDKRFADLVLIVCFCIAGLIDAGAYNAYECFTSMQVSFQLHCLSGSSSNRREYRQHGVRRPRSLQSTDLLATPSLDQVSLRCDMLSSGLSHDSVVPPHVRSVQAMGTRELLHLTSGLHPDLSHTRWAWPFFRLSSLRGRPKLAQYSR